MRQYFEMSPHPQDQIDDEEDEVEEQQSNANSNNQQENNAQQGNEVEEMLENLAIDEDTDKETTQNRQGSSGSA